MSSRLRQGPARYGGGLVVAVTEASTRTATFALVIIEGPHKGLFTRQAYGDFDITDGALLAGWRPAAVGAPVFDAARRQDAARRVFRWRYRREGASPTARFMLEADMGYQIDNMERASPCTVLRAAKPLLTLVSDDNFSVIQRNLLLQFAIVEER